MAGKANIAVATKDLSNSWYFLALGRRWTQTLSGAGSEFKVDPLDRIVATNLGFLDCYENGAMPMATRPIIQGMPFKVEACLPHRPAPPGRNAPDSVPLEQFEVPA